MRRYTQAELDEVFLDEEEVEEFKKRRQKLREAYQRVLEAQDAYDLLAHRFDDFVAPLVERIEEAAQDASEESDPALYHLKHPWRILSPIFTYGEPDEDEDPTQSLFEIPFTRREMESDDD